jgi:hypothetical protein
MNRRFYSWYYGKPQASGSVQISCGGYHIRKTFRIFGSFEGAIAGSHAGSIASKAALMDRRDLRFIGLTY